MTLKDVERRHETRERILHSIIRISQNSSTIKMSVVSELTEQLEGYREIDLKLITQFQSAQGIPNPCKGVGSNHSNLISAQEAETALRAAQGMLNRHSAQEIRLKDSHFPLGTVSFPFNKQKIMHETRIAEERLDADIEMANFLWNDKRLKEPTMLAFYEYTSVTAFNKQDRERLTDMRDILKIYASQNP